MTFTLCHAAGDMFMGASRRVAVIDFAESHGDVFTVSESQKDHAALRDNPATDVFAVGELGIGWRLSKLEKSDHGSRQVMRGGRRGPLAAAGRIIPKRLRRARRGPSRFVAWVLLTERATGKQVIVSTHHAIAKGDTSHKWRRPLRRQGFVGAMNELNAARRRYPDAAVIFTGDLNTRGGILAIVRAGLTRVGRLATFGRLSYDRIYKRGCKITAVHRAKTAGDHKALIATVTL